MKPRSYFGDSVFLIFGLSQLAGRVLTYLGVHVFGREIEANPILAWYIAVLGAGAVLLAKMLAVGCASALHLAARHRTIGVLTVFYLAIAVWPWVTLFSEVAS